MRPGKSAVHTAALKPGDGGRGTLLESISVIAARGDRTLQGCTCREAGIVVFNRSTFDLITTVQG